MTAERKENKMGVMPVKKLIISMSLPMMISMLVQALYNIVDSVYVARLSESALTAVTLAFPLQNLMIALGSGTGVGINALLSRSLGQKRFDKSDAAANTGLLLTGFNTVAFILIGLFAASWFIHTQTADPAAQDFPVGFQPGHVPGNQ
jgi:Na+-driven multidrug efflux pump